MARKLFSKTLLLLTLVNFSCLNAQEYKSPDYIFEPHSILNLSLECDLKTLRREKNDPEYIPAKLSINTHDTTQFDVMVRTRGNFRKRHCYYPPLKVKLDPEQTQGTILSQTEKFKLVIPCSTYDQYNHFIMREYMAYRIYGMFTEESYQVQLLKINLIDSGTNKQDELFAFLIENKHDMAKRLEGIPIDADKINPQDIDTEQAMLVSVFQYFIGNTDWSLYHTHNLQLFKTKKASRKPIVIPYDFDLSGLVNPPYANIVDNPEINTPMERIFYGPKRNMEEWQQTLDKFRDSKDEIYNFILDFPYEEDRFKRSILSWFDEFYSLIDNPRSLDRTFVDNGKTIY